MGKRHPRRPGGRGQCWPRARRDPAEPGRRDKSHGTKAEAARSFINTSFKLQYSRKHSIQFGITHDTHNNTIFPIVSLLFFTSTPGKGVTVPSATWRRVKQGPSLPANVRAGCVAEDAKQARPEDSAGRLPV